MDDLPPPPVSSTRHQRALVTMDDLPPPLVLEILNRLSDSGDLARCRVASKALDALSRKVRSINLQYSFDRYTKSRSPPNTTNSSSPIITPFKAIFKTLISSSSNVESVSIGVDERLREVSYDDVEVEADDLYLTDFRFVSDWLLRDGVCRRLRSISISDFWVQSCRRKSEVLALISSCCFSLVELELKNAWLSVDGLALMPMLKSLTLEFVRLDDKDLNKVNNCFPSLQALNLLWVGGLKEPKIHLLYLETCQWTVLNDPVPLTIIAPNLVKLKLECVKPRLLVIDAPLLSNFYLSIEKANRCVVKEFQNLKYLELESRDLIGLVGIFPCCRTLTDLTVGWSKWFGDVEMSLFNHKTLFDVFPNMTSLTLGPAVWSKVKACFHAGASEGGTWMKGLKAINAQVIGTNTEVTPSVISYLLENCINLTDLTLHIHYKVPESVASKLILSCMANYPRVKWKWITRTEGRNVSWRSLPSI